MRESRRTRILLIIPNLGRGGAQQVFRQQLLHLSSAFDVAGCVFNWDDAFPEDRELNHYSLDVPGGKSFLGKIYNFILRIKRLRKLKKELGVDVTISHLEGADYVNLLSLTSDKTICWIHGSKEYDQNISGVLGVLRLKFFIPALYKRANRIVTVSKGLAKELSRLVKDGRIQVIYNGFDIGKINELKEESPDEGFASLFKESKVIITHCRLSYEKNLQALLLIYKGLSKRSSVKLMVVGDGELREELLSCCRQLGLKYWAQWENKSVDSSCEILFLGYQSNPFRLLHRSSLYAMTSLWEGFPLALCEAMACGLPVITTDCFTGPREIVAMKIDSEQPVKTPYHADFGVLMPLVNVSDPEIISCWSAEIENLLLSVSQNSNKNLAGIERIKEFALSESIRQTVNLVREIST